MPRPEPQIRFCRAVTQIRHIDENDIYKLFELIQAPNNLLSFFHIIPILPDVFKTAIEIAAIDELADDQYQDVGKTANILNSLLPDLQNNPRLRDFHPPVPMPRFGPCYGILLTHPLYSALAENVPNRDYYGSLVYLKSHIFLAVESLGHIDQKLLEELRDPFICFRKLTRPKNWPYLSRLPNQAVPASSFAQIFRSKFHGTPFQPIGKIFQLAEKTFHKRKRTQGTSSKSKVFVPRRSREDDEDPTLDYVQDIQPPTTLTQLESEDYIVHGGLPEELGGDVDLEPALAGYKYHGPTRRQLVFQAKQASNRRAMENQFCALAWNQANLYDLKILFGFLEGDHQLEGFDFQHLSREEVVVVLGLMFYTCNPLERLLSFPVFNGIKPILNSPEGLYLEENRATIRLHSPGPELTTRVTRQTGTFPVEQHVNLPLPECFFRCLEKTQPVG